MSDNEMDGHWHIFVAMPGYLPEGDVDTVSSWYDLAAELQEEFDRASDQARQQADAFGEAKDYEAAWRTVKLAEELHDHAEEVTAIWVAVRAGGLSEAEAIERFRSTLETIFGHENGGSVAVSKAAHLYANPCTDGDSCEHLEDGE